MTNENEMINDSQNSLTQPLVFWNRQFENPWPTWRNTTLYAALQLIFTKDLTYLPEDGRVYIFFIVFYFLLVFVAMLVTVEHYIRRKSQMIW